MIRLLQPCNILYRHSLTLACFTGMVQQLNVAPRLGCSFGDRQRHMSIHCAAASVRSSVLNLLTAHPLFCCKLQCQHRYCLVLRVEPFKRMRCPVLQASVGVREASRQVQLLRNSLEDDEQLKSLMAGLRGANIDSSDFASANVNMQLLEYQARPGHFI